MEFLFTPSFIPPFDCRLKLPLFALSGILHLKRTQSKGIVSKVQRSAC